MPTISKEHVNKQRDTLEVLEKKEEYIPESPNKNQILMFEFLLGNADKNYYRSVFT